MIACARVCRLLVCISVHVESKQCRYYMYVNVFMHIYARARKFFGTYERAFGGHNVPNYSCVCACLCVFIR